jgi:hypothetical protein
MTLLVNEIYIHQHLGHGLIILAADRRVTIDGKFHSNRKKLFRISYLNAGVGYFGLAQVNNTEFLSGWLPDFIRHACGVKSLEEFSRSLCDELNRKVNKGFLKKAPSGFHICGYNAKNLPELWFISNIQSMQGHIYKGFEAEYCITEDFLGRDAQKLGFNGVDPEVPNVCTQYYVNGDIRAFHSIWVRLDEFLEEMFSQDDFKCPRQVADMEAIIRWKMGVISSFYKQFAKKQIIGTPIDVFVLLPERHAG